MAAAVTFSAQASTAISLILAALVCALLTSGELRRFGPFVWLVEATTPIEHRPEGPDRLQALSRPR